MQTPKVVGFLVQGEGFCSDVVTKSLLLNGGAGVAISYILSMHMFGVFFVKIGSDSYRTGEQGVHFC